MARIPDELKAEILERVDLVALIGERVQLKKAGTARHKGLCPFHQEKTPSFHVLEDKRFYHCFGCQKSGDAIRFLMEIDGKTFGEAARELAGKVGVTLPETSSPEDRARMGERGRLLEVNAVAASFYREVLQSEGGLRGREYLRSRGIGDEVAETFRLGMAPDAWDALVRRLEARKQSHEAALALGLIAPRTKSSGFYDRFRHRLMCPVLLPAGEVVAFSGRTLGGDPEAPKYINSPGSPVYAKGKELFGLHAAQASFRRKERALVVEGNFDVIALHQAGFAETVAPLGTALTERQVETLRRLTPRVVLCLDGDRAGRAAALKDIALLVAAGVESRIVDLPDGDDPDSFVRAHGAEALEKKIAGAPLGVDFFLFAIWGGTNRSAETKAQAIREAADLLSKVPDDTRKAILVHQFAQGLDVDAGVLRRAIGAPQRMIAPPVRPQKPQLPPAKELKVIQLLWDHPELFDLADQLGVRSLLTDVRLRDMYSASHAGRPVHESVPADLMDVVTGSAGEFKNIPDPASTLKDAVRSLERDHLQTQIRDIDRRFKDAVREGNSALARELSMLLVQTQRKAR